MSDGLSSNPADYIEPLSINKLEGRMLYMPAKANKKRDILLVYGHHATIERWWSLAENLNDYGSVTMPDLPGFGGMESFSKIGLKPNIDNFADYLETFIKLRFSHKKITLVGVSYGFVIITRMLQRHPALTDKVDMLISLSGFMHYDDYLYTPSQRKLYSVFSHVLATRPLCFIQRTCFLNEPFITFINNRAPISKERHLKYAPAEYKAMMEFETNIWENNDLKTNWLTISEFLKLDNCETRINLPVIHVSSKTDGYFSEEIVKQHMLVVFKEFKGYISTSKEHAPSIIADKKAAGTLIPPALRRLLNR